MFGRFRPNPPQCSGDSGQTPPNVGAISARPKSHQHWGPQCSGDFGQNPPNVRAISAKPPPMFGRFRPNPPQCWGDFGQAEKPRTLGPPVFGRFRPKPPQCSGDFGQTPPNVRAIPAKPPQCWGDFGQAEKPPTLGVRLAGIARTLGAPVFVAFRPGRNRPNIGGPNVRDFSARPKCKLGRKVLFCRLPGPERPRSGSGEAPGTSGS